MAPKGMLRLFLADYDGNVIAGTIAITFSDKCWYVYGASGNEYRNVMPNHALQWAMIQWAKEKGCPVYDFRGIPCDLSPEHPLHGLVRFKKGFGAYPVRYVGEYEMTFAPFIALVHKHGMPAYTKLRKLLRK
jgi:peptidoglycan pentaglycine glycine transferase (the first glycine)